MSGKANIEMTGAGSGRRAGVLLHPSSLAGPYGIGELGPEAFGFLRFLESSGQRIWQILPLNPPAPDGSPYSSASAFAGSPLLISTDRLIEDGLVSRPASSPPGPVDYGAVARTKMKLLREAHRNASGDTDTSAELERFGEANEYWLGDYALYAALKERFGGRPWTRWSAQLARRDSKALEEARAQLASEISFQKFVQYLFERNYEAVQQAAKTAGVEIIGDLPIFVSHDSADVWANQELFYLKENGEPEVVSGVPPDYFSETGQLWGNPLYRWDRMSETGYTWWVNRMHRALELYDLVRIDHFRGFQACWEVPAEADTAKEGRWVAGPGKRLFRTLEKSLGHLPIIAEDLGTITPDVERLRADLGFPGMKVLQFAFSDPDNPYLPHNFGGSGWISYTGTHDNDTTAGWWASASHGERSFARRYLGREYVSVWDFIRLAHSSVAAYSVIPMQDVLCLGSEARMNFPGRTGGSWAWRLSGGELTAGLAKRLREVTELYRRA